MLIFDHPGLQLGGRLFCEIKGDLAEILVYQRTLTEDERKKVEDYLGAKYGIKITRP